MARYRFSVSVWHRRLGKSVAHVNSIQMSALARPGTTYAYIAPFLKQSRKIAWPIFQRYAIPGTKFDKSELEIHWANGSVCHLWGADNADSHRGSGLNGIVADEFAQFREGVWDSVFLPMLAGQEDYWISLVGTPNGMNRFHEAYVKALKDPRWLVTEYTADETKVIPAEDLEMLRGSMAPAAFRQEFLCDWTASAGNVLMPIDVVTEAMKRVLPARADLRGLPKVLGVDVARYGDDRSAVCRRHGHHVESLKFYDQQSNVQLANIVAHHINDWKPDAVFIDGGRGEGVIDFLRHAGHNNVIEVGFGWKATKAGYANMRAQMYDNFSTHVEEGLVLPDDPDLKREMCAVTYSFRASDGAMQIDDKDKIKEEIGRSIDGADAVAVTYAMPVSTLPHNERPAQHAHEILQRPTNQGYAIGRDYSPLGER